MHLKIRHSNYHGFDLKAVARHYPEAYYLGDVECENGVTWGMFHQPHPDYSKGHKDIMMLCNTHITGREPEAAKFLAWTHGVLCFRCKMYIYSSHRHDMVNCECGHAMIDGGKGPYGRMGGTDIGFLSYNLITHELMQTEHP